MLTVTKSVKFDAAHVLTNHQGLCKNLHGHTYRVEVSVTQAPGDNADMVIDFKDLKKKCEEVILERYDHAFIYGMRAVAMPYRSTAENLARHFFGVLRERVAGLSRVRVWETPDSSAEYSE